VGYYDAVALAFAVGYSVYGVSAWSSSGVSIVRRSGATDLAGVNITILGT
jgi:hypothetical protein